MTIVPDTKTVPVPLLVDCDPGVDDLFALLYAAYLEDVGRVRLLGVSTVFGNLGALPGAENALRILQLVGRRHVPVAVGADHALDGSREHTAEFVHGTDGLGGAAGAKTEARPVDESAAVQIVHAAHENPGEVCLLAIGPLTNVALALRLEPELPSLLRRVVWMGGRVAVPGNLTAAADANTFHDPEAAELTLSSGIDMTIVPMDVTRFGWVGEEWLDRLARHGSPVTDFASAAVKHYVNVYTALEGPARGERGCVLHDPMALALLMEPELATYLDVAMEVELTGTRTRGMTLVDQRGYVTPADPGAPGRPTVRIAWTVDHKTVTQRILDSVTALDPR